MSLFDDFRNKAKEFERVLSERLRGDDSMTLNDRTSLQAQLNDIRYNSEPQACAAIKRLESLARELDPKDDNKITQDLMKSEEGLRSDKFKIIVVGRFKTGKSTFINAILGSDVMPTNDLPTTATLTYINYSDNPYVRVHKKDGETEEWTFDKYNELAIIKPDAEETKNFFSDIEYFELGLPKASLCQSGVTLIDSPGTSDVPTRTALTREAVRRSDVSIFLFRSDTLAGEDEIEFANSVLDDQSRQRAFSMINLRDRRTPDDRLKEFAWNKVVRGLDLSRQTYGSRTEAFQDVGVYFIDAKQALDGRIGNDKTLVQNSGILNFEEALGKFLAEERYIVHFERFVSEAIKQVEPLQSQISKRQSAIRKSEEELQEKYKQSKEKLTEIDRRYEGIDKLFARYPDECSRVLNSSFKAMLFNLTRNLERLVKHENLKSLEGLGGTLNSVFRQKSVVTEAQGILGRIIEERIDNWRKVEAQREVEKVLENFENELRRDVEEMEKLANQVSLTITGWRPNSNIGADLDDVRQPVGWFERIFLSGVAMATGNLGAAFGAGVGGWRGLGTAFSAQIITATVLVLAGLPVTFPAVITVALIGSIAGSAGTAMNLKNRIWDKILEGVDPKFHEWSKSAESEIAQNVSQIFNDIERQVKTELTKLIESEKRQIQKYLDDAKKDVEEKQAIFKHCDEMSEDVSKQKEILRQLIAEVKQTF